MNSAVFLFPLIVAKKLNIEKIIAHAHNASNDKGMLKSILHIINRNFIKYYANYFFACSESAKKYFWGKNIKESKETIIINNAINLGKFQYNSEIRNNKRKELNVENNVVIGNIGRFNKQKNQLFLLEIFKQFLYINNKAILMLIGTGDLEKNIKLKVKELGIENKIIFMKNRSDINELLQAMDILIMPSLYEGLSLVTVEAQTSGLSCLLSDTISKECELSKCVYFYSLKKSPHDWAIQANNIINESGVRKSNLKEIENKGFEIKLEAKKLESLYLK